MILLCIIRLKAFFNAVTFLIKLFELFFILAPCVVAHGAGVDLQPWLAGFVNVIRHARGLVKIEGSSHPLFPSYKFPSVLTDNST